MTNTIPITMGEAKRLVTTYLSFNDIKYDKLKGRTVDFTDLARDGCIFIDIIGWKGTPEQRQKLRGIAIENGFRLQPTGIM